MVTLRAGPRPSFSPTPVNPIGIHYGYWTQNWDVDFVPLVHRAKRSGFDVLEVNAGTVTRSSEPERDRLKRAAADAGLGLTYCIGLPPDLDLASADAATRERGVAFLREMTRTVGSLGGTCLTGIIYSSWPRKLLPGEDKWACVDRSVAGVRAAVKTAEDCGVTLNVEVVNRFEQFIMNTAAEGIEFVQRVDSPNCRVLLDTFHLNIEEDSIREAIVATGDHLGHFHIGETNRRPPGRGRIPWAEVFGALGEINYRGALVMEPFVVPGGEVGRDISVYRDLRHGYDLDAEAARSVEFVRAGLAAHPAPTAAG